MEGGSPDQSFNFRYCKMTSPLYESLARLLTEQRNPSTMDLDMLSVTEVLRRISLCRWRWNARFPISPALWSLSWRR